MDDEASQTEGTAAEKVGGAQGTATGNKEPSPSFATPVAPPTKLHQNLLPHRCQAIGGMGRKGCHLGFGAAAALAEDDFQHGSQPSPSLVSLRQVAELHCPEGRDEGDGCALR